MAVHDFNPSLAESPSLDSLLPHGFASPAQDYFSGRIDLNKALVAAPATTHLVPVTDNAMAGAGICEGDEILVDTAKKPRNGSVVLVVIDGEFLLRRIRQGTHNTTLESAHQNYPAIEVTEEMTMSIWGTVTRCLHKV